MGHRRGYFRCAFHKWAIAEYITYMLRNHPELPSRDITGRWAKTLGRMAKCSECCSRRVRTRASELLKAYKRTGLSSDRAIAERLLAEGPHAGGSKEIHFTVNAPSTVVASSGSIVTSTLAGTANPIESTITDERSPSVDHFSDLDEDADDLDEESDGMTPVPDLDDVFRTAYDSFEDDLKWKLPSGSTVEDVLYDAYWSKSSRPSIRNLIRNWIVDTGSEKMKALFSEADWAAIKTEVPPLPDVDPDFARSLLRFSKVKTVADLRNVVRTTSYMSTDVPYDRARHFDMDWAELVIRQLLRLYEDEEKPLRGQHLEDWYCYNVWSDIVDKCFQSLRHVTLEREVTCQSSALRKNRNRTETSSRMKSGPRLDGVVRSVDDDSREFCAIESARRLRGGTSSTKWLSDNAKLQKVLRDMLSRLVTLVDNDPQIVGQLQVVGISTAGLHLQVTRLCHRKGYVCLSTREQLFSVPDDVMQVKQLLLLLVAVVQTKGVLAESIDGFRSRMQRSSEGDDAFLQVLLHKSPPEDVPTPDFATLPQSADSP